MVQIAFCIDKRHFQVTLVPSFNAMAGVSVKINIAIARAGVNMDINVLTTALVSMVHFRG